MNGGFGLVLDGSADAERRAGQMLSWDVHNGGEAVDYCALYAQGVLAVSRRCWSGNDNAEMQIVVEMAANPDLQVPLPSSCARTAQVLLWTGYNAEPR